jgi:DNA-binding NarL/FixJ family response regulator
MIRVLLVAKDYVVRKAVRLLLAIDPDVEIVAQAADVEDIPVLVTVLKPDLIVLDAGKCRPATRQLIHTLDCTFRNRPMLVLHDAEDEASLASRGDNITLLCKDATNETLIDTVYRVARRPRLLGAGPDEAP